MVQPQRFRPALHRPRGRSAQGYVLPLVVAVGLIITLGSVALLVRGSGALIGSSRQQRSREALAIAEAGLESTLALLNTKHPYLLTNDHNPDQDSCWAATGACTASTAQFPTGLCREMTEANQVAIPLTGSISNASGVIGDWRVVRYTFGGTSLFGGSGRLRIEGVRRSSANGPVLARSQVEQEMSVRIKNCTPTGLNTVALLAIESPMQVNQTKIYALTPEQVAALANDSNNDGLPDVVPPPVITPTDPAAAHCINCSSLAELNIANSAVGFWSYGPMPYPNVPTAPAGLTAWDMLLRSNDPPLSRQIWAGRSRNEGGSSVCLVDGAGTTHCRIRRIRIRGSESNALKIVYPLNRNTNRQVRLYIQQDVTLSGNSRICQAVYTGTPVLVRTPIAPDSISDSGEQFQLTATPVAAPSGAKTGTATIGELQGSFYPDANGNYLPVNNVPDPSAQPLTVSSPFVNEASSYAVFVVTVTSTASQAVSFALSPLSATGGGVDFGTSATSGIEYSLDGGLTWSPYNALGSVTLAGYSYPPSDPSVDPPCLDNPESTGLNSSFYGLRSRDLLIFGNPDCSLDQNITLNGGPQTLHLFTYAPCSDVTINGGSSTPDIYGAVWSKTYTPSGSGNVDIWVPPDLSSDLETIYGGTFTITRRRPVALGSNRWSSYEAAQP